MTKKTVYIEILVVSYLTARPTANLLAAAWQKVTLDWWETQRRRFDLFTSEVTVQEAGRGESGGAGQTARSARRHTAATDHRRVGPLATALVRGGILPEKALNDALHVPVAAAHRVDYLLTWNYRHLDNAETKPAIRDTCVRHGLSSPEICTPWELMGDQEDAG